jgi:hypothetical protein
MISYADADTSKGFEIEPQIIHARHKRSIETASKIVKKKL